MNVTSVAVINRQSVRVRQLLLARNIKAVEYRLMHDYTSLFSSRAIIADSGDTMSFHLKQIVRDLPGRKR